MEYRFLGRSGLQVSGISLGGWLTYGGHVANGMLLQYPIFRHRYQHLSLRFCLDLGGLWCSGCGCGWKVLFCFNFQPRSTQNANE